MRKAIFLAFLFISCTNVSDKKKEDILLKERDKFIKGAIKKGYAEDLAIKIYDLIFRFAEYGFNKSHTVAYAMISYKMAYLKAHYPKVFMKHLLNQAINSETKTKEYIYECKQCGITIEKPNINLSSDKYEIINNKIIYPLTNIKNIGVNVTKLIIEERKKGKFKDIFDFISRCYKGNITSKIIESLILSGAFDTFNFSRKTLIENIEVLTNYGEIGEYLDDELFRPELEIKKEYSSHELMAQELEIFGFYLSNNPITEYKNKNKHIDLKNIHMYFDKIIETVIYVDKIRTITTKNNEKMMFITGSDEISKADIVVFPRVYNENNNIKEKDIIKIKGKVEKRYDEFQIIANNIIKLN